MSIAKRGRLYHLRRRVPGRYSGVEPRQVIWISLHTDSQTIARSKADRAWNQMIEAWEARLAGNSADAEARYEAARDLAQARGFRYLDLGAVARPPVEQVVTFPAQLRISIHGAGWRESEIDRWVREPEGWRQYGVNG